MAEEGRFTTWVHGASMQVEYLNRITAARHTGPFVRIEGAAGQNTWLHFPVPALTEANGRGVRVAAVRASFRTRAHAVVHEVILYDGERRIAEHTDLGLQGDQLGARFEVPGAPLVQGGLNVTLGVSFPAGAPEVREMQLEVVGVGVEFVVG